jgi:hypothetical protein
MVVNHQWSGISSLIRMGRLRSKASISWQQRFANIVLVLKRKTYDDPNILEMIIGFRSDDKKEPVIKRGYRFFCRKGVHGKNAAAAGSNYRFESLRGGAVGLSHISEEL